MGGPSDDLASGVALDASGSVYTVGGFRETVDFDPGPGVFNLSTVGPFDLSDDIFVSKLDSDGDFVWARAMGGTSVDSGFAVAVATNGDVYTVGVMSGLESCLARA